VELVLVRHAEPDAAVRDRCYGSLDVGLSTVGRTDADRLADELAGRRVDRVVSSPLRRAFDTAQPIAARHGLAVEACAGLREIDFGELEGRTYDEIAASLPALYHRWMSSPTEVVFPGGEGYDDLRRRALDAVSALRRDADADSVVVAVTHGGVVRTVVADVLRIPAEHLFRLSVQPAGMARIRWIDDVPVLYELSNARTA
jgi:broad specificity phosphatase PhoE